MFRLSLRLINVVVLWVFLVPAAFGLQELPPQPTPIKYNTLSSEWLVRAEDGTLEPFGQEEHQNSKAFHKWVKIVPGSPLLVEFTSLPGVCVFMNNRLAYRAAFAGKHKINLSDTRFFGPDSLSPTLITIWHPEEQPLISSFKVSAPALENTKAEEAGVLMPLAKKVTSQSTYLLFLLAIGLLYGYLRVQHSTAWASVFKPTLFFREAADDSFYKKPVLSVSSLLFLVVFSLSLALVIVAVQRSLHETIVLHQTFGEGRTGIAASVLTGSGVILLAMLGKYLFLNAAGYIFNYQALVPVQYREFIRYSLIFGLLLPILLLLHLSFGDKGQAQVAFMVNVVLMLLLIVPAVRIFYLISTKYKLGSVQLVCYLCATEAIPLAIILKIIFLSYL